MSFCLNAKSDYSFLSSILTIDDIISFCKKTNNTYASLIDYNLHGSYEFYHKCLINNLKPIIGLETNINFNGEIFPLIFVALSKYGFHNLSLISSRANENKNNEVLLNNITLYTQDVAIIIPSLNSYLAYYIKNNGIFDANIFIDTLKSMFKDIYLGIYRYNNYDKGLINNLKEYANHVNIKCIAMQHVTHKDIKDTIVLNMVDCIKNNIQANKAFLEESSIVEAYFKDDMALKVYYDNDELKNLNEFAKTVNVVIEKVEFELPSLVNNSNEYLKETVFNKLKEKNITSQKYIDRVNYELSIITKMGFANYYLVVADYVNFAKNNHILVGPARGSGGASLVAYLLNITTIDPLKYDLLFERFLNPERISYPDFDIDFQDIKRDKIINYVKEKYGNKNVAHIATYSTFGPKSALRDLGRVLKISNQDMDYLTSFMSKDCKSINNEYQNNEKFKAVVDIHKNYKILCELAAKIEGLKKQVGLHAAGIIISHERIDNLVPTFNIDENTIAIQYDFLTAEKLGLIKIDFLGLKNLTIIDYCFEKIEEIYHIKYDINDYDFDDENIYKMISDGITLGLFQLESKGINKVIEKMKPSSFADIVAIISLYRPGPMDMIDEYILRKNGKEYKMPLELKEIMDPTYGIIIYQEQIMMICQKIASFSLGEADILRRAISKKDLAMMKSLKEKFIKQSIANGYDVKMASGIYTLIEKFANYGFNKAHSVGYGKITCIMASLKYKYPSIFYEALINVNSMSGNGLAYLIKEAKYFNINLQYPNINTSSNYVKALNDNTLLLGLCNIKSIKEPIANIIIEDRKIAPYSDLNDFVIRMAIKDISIQIIYDLTYAGALDDFNIPRNKIVANLENIYNNALLFKGLDYMPNTYKDEKYSFIDMPLLAFIDNETDFIAKEYEMLGIYLHEHPLTSLKKSYVNITDIDKLDHTKDVNIIGKIIQIEKKQTKNKEDYLTFKIEDETGNVFVSCYDNVDNIYNDFKKYDLVYLTLHAKGRYYNITTIKKVKETS